MKTKKPTLWLITLIAGLPILSETIYAPSMPNMAQSLQVPEAWIEYTLSIYMAGFAVGVFFWGQLSDRLGRRTCLLLGFSLYVLACLGCYYAKDYQALLLARFVQAFGGSVGSVLGQAVARDSFQGSDLAKAYALLGSALAVFPAVGSFSGGLITSYAHWSSLFLVLFVLGTMLATLIALQLPETHTRPQNKHPRLNIIKAMILDPKVLCYGFIVAASNGISFSYFAEGSFFFIEELHIKPQWYGASFAGFAAASLVGGIISRKLLHTRHATEVLSFGIHTIVLGSALLVIQVLLSQWFNWSHLSTALMSILSMMVIGMGICMATSNALAMAVEDYRYAVGTASSFFGFGYYTLIALFTYLMGWLHNGTLMPMPLYFLGLALLMLVVEKRLHLKKATEVVLH